MNDPKVRYSDEELQEFKTLIEEKLVIAQEELRTTEQQITDLNENGFNQQGGDWYDDSTAHTDLEMLQRMLIRQQRYVQDLRNALIRIGNKTYGICIVTGLLISKERLRLVPHATKSIDGKNLANSAKEGASETSGGDPFNGTDGPRSTGKPIGDKVRLTNGKRPNQTNEDWEIDNETLENVSNYSSGSTRKSDDDDE